MGTWLTLASLMVMVRRHPSLQHHPAQDVVFFLPIFRTSLTSFNPDTDLESFRLNWRSGLLMLTM